MELSSADGEGNINERNDHVCGVKHTGCLAADEHGKGLYSCSLVALNIKGIVGVKDGNGDDSYGDAEYEGIPYELAGHRICGPDDRQYSEYDEDIHVSKGMVFQEGIKEREQYSHAADNP